MKGWKFQIKGWKNVITARLQKFELSNLEASFATPESTLTAIKYMFQNFVFFIFLNRSFLKIQKKTEKRHISKSKKNRAVKLGGNLRNTRENPYITQLQGWEFHGFLFSNLTFLKTEKRIIKNASSR